jgi:hypothetical protein
MKTNLAFFLLCLFAFLASCEKEDDGEHVVVQGSVYDDVLQEPVENMLVYVYDVACKNFMCARNQIVDSTRTDSNGMFKMNYKTNNLNSLYVELGYPSRSYVPAGNQQSSYQLVRGNNAAHFTVRKTSVLKARVLVANNPQPTLKVFDGIEAHMVEIPGMNKDTVIYLRAVANQTNTIDLLAHSPDMQYYRRRTDYFHPLGYADTLNITIEAEPNSFPITSY